MEISGAKILLESLKCEGIDTIFGYPGGCVLDVYDELRNYPELKHILVRHEQAAVHAADGYARALGKVGVCIVTSGPGATNTVTGIATAYCDSIPLVVISGQVPTALIGNDAFQEVDIIGITRPCTKHNFLVKDIKDLAKILKQAFHIARSGRPGPVLIDFPKDIMQQKTKFSYPETIQMRSYNPNYKPNNHQIAKALSVLSKAERPLVLAGGGIIMGNASAELQEFVHSHKLPVVTSLMGLGGFSGTDPLNYGMLGMHGAYEANMAINNCDVLIALGVRFDDRVTGRLNAFASKAQIIHVDIDPTSIHKNVEVHIPIVCDCKEALKAMLELAKSDKYPKPDINAWHQQIIDWRDSVKLEVQTKQKSESALKPKAVIEEIYKITKGEAIITTEVGQNQMWAAQYMPYTRPRSFITSGGLGTMGYGLPAAIGAQLACPNSLVIDIAGDGSIQMNIQELITAVSNNLAIKIVILNNGYLGMVRQMQELFYAKNYSFTPMDAQPDFVKLAEAYGAEGYRITTQEELNSTLSIALNSPNTAIIDIKIDREENVYPMVPSGASLADMLLA